MGNPAKRVKKKIENKIDKVQNYFERAGESVGDYAKKAGQSVETWGKEVSENSKEYYNKYKPQIIQYGLTAAGILVGSALAPFTAGMSVPVFAQMGWEAGAKINQHKAEKDYERQMEKSISNSTYPNAAQRRIGQRIRQGGEGDVSYSTLEDASDPGPQMQG